MADICADAALLPFSDGEFERVEMIHLIEHLGYLKAIHAVAECFRVLEPGGTLVVETPDCEGSFRRFLGDRSQENRAQLLSWIFGLDTPGYLHRLLLPEDLLRRTLQEAGFEEVRRGPCRTHLYAPGLRVEARRGGLPVHLLLAHLRRQVRSSGALDLTHQLQALEFETVFVDNLLALGGARDLPPDAERAAFSNILMAPQAAMIWLDLCPQHGIELPFERAHMAGLARAAVEEDLPGRLDALFDELCVKGTEADDGYLHLCDQGLSALSKAFESGVEKMRSVLKEQLPPSVPWADGAPLSAEEDLGLEDPCQPASGGERRGLRPALVEHRPDGRDLPPPVATRPFTRALLRSRVNGMHDLAVRLLVHDRQEEAMALLERAANSRIDPFYPLWNLAVAHARRGEHQRSIGRYQEALDLAAPVTRPVLLRELAVLYLHAGRPQDVVDLARQVQSDEHWATILRLARQTLDAEQPSGQPELVPLRTRPVLAGESLYHEPDTA
ncbi:MAG: methyltransferase domain-containing protein [Bradymonadales bacterium]|nr:methyltransferase domain-containing protein [Bradymonadales bacterium]